MVWYFIGVYIIHRTLHGRLEIQNFSSRVEKIFHSFAALTREIFFNTRREISPRPCNILYMLSSTCIILHIILNLIQSLLLKLFVIKITCLFEQLSMKCFLQTIETSFSFFVYVEQKDKCWTINKKTERQHFNEESS